MIVKKGLQFGLIFLLKTLNRKDRKENPQGSQRKKSARISLNPCLC